jgi:diguanylate cyclase (GGDEF)-like protein/PAS domain S-box-containing protein/putative nucleotidyltransferase with HDIG domain
MSIDRPDFQAIVDIARELAQAVFCTLSVYEEDSSVFANVAFSGSREQAAAASAVLGFELTRRHCYRAPCSGERATGITRREYANLTEYARQTLSHDIPEVIAKQLILGKITVFSLRQGAQLRGNLTLFMPLAAEYENAVVVEIFAHMVGSMLDRIKVEQKQSHQEKQLSAIFDHAGVGVCLLTPDSKFLKVNKKFCEITGYSEQELLSLYCRDISDPGDIQRDKALGFKALLQRLLRTGEPYSRIKRHVHKQGHHVWLDTSTSLLRGEKGSPDMLIRVYQDVTERKQAEEALLTEKEQLRLLVTQMQLGLAHADIICDEEGKPVNYRYVSANDSFERLTGRRREDLVGKTALELFPNLERHWLETYGRVAMTGKPDQVEHYSSRLGKYLSTTIYSPKPGQFAVIVEDETEKKRAEEALNKEREQFRTTLLSVGDGVISTDRQGNVLILNKVAEQLTGWTQSEAFGKPIEEVFHIINDSRERIENLAQMVLSTGDAVERANHTILVSRDKSEKPIEDSAAPIRDEKGNINGVVLVFRDFTDKKQRQDEIEYLSFHDQLTGLYNRRFYEAELKRLDTARNLPLTLVIGDVNGLKLINDSFGHVTGDELLKKAAEVIKKGCRADDIIARIGGDEFVMILPNTDALAAERIVDRIKSLALEEKVNSMDVSISFGHETKHNEDKKMQEVFRKAEDSMYHNKLFESPSMRGKTIDTIIRTLHEKNEREEKHSKRVSVLCERMGEVLGLSEHKTKELKTVGLLHDIGKIAIDEHLLSKPSELTGEEWSKIKRHPEIGYRILSTVNEMSEISEYILAHHERRDGNGYPRGLRGEEVPLEARIIAIADAYDAMTSARPYRIALSVEAALAELKKNAGTQFDQQLVGVFIEKVLGKPE